MSISSWTERIGNELLDLVYPPGLYCLSCGKITDASRTYGLCNDCMAAMNWVDPAHCEKCGRPLSQNDPGRICFRCSVRESSATPYSFNKGFACAGYGAVEQSVIFLLKYGSRSDIGDVLGEVLYDRMASELGADVLAGMYDIVMPVPTHREKEKKRGYNHADLMGRSFAKRAGLSYDPSTIRRARATKPMKGLGPGEREANIRGAFEIKEWKHGRISGARVLLIDDIFTTGSTVNEIARILKEPWKNKDGQTLPGAARVDFLAFAAAGDMVLS